MKVYIVFWSNFNDDWSVKKVFSTMDKAQNYVKEQNGNHWIGERELE